MSGPPGKDPEVDASAVSGADIILETAAGVLPVRIDELHFFRRDKAPVRPPLHQQRHEWEHRRPIGSPCPPFDPGAATACCGDGRLKNERGSGHAHGISVIERRPHMDLNMEYAAHQKALMSAKCALSDLDRQAHLLDASIIADRIGVFQKSLGAAAACAWCASQFATSVST